LLWKEGGVLEMAVS